LEVGEPTMDFLYFYKKTQDDFELRYSLRSVERYAPWVGKVWIYGDRPDFLTSDVSVAEHVPDSFGTAVLGVQPPVENFFLMLFLSSLIPELTPEYIWCSDDHFLMKDYPTDEARKVRFVEDLRTATRPAQPGTWRAQLLRTYDALVQLGYPTYNFESHTPIYLTKRRVLSAYCDLRDLVTEDKWYGLMGASSILNHAVKHDGMVVHSMEEEESSVGWAPSTAGRVKGVRQLPASYDEALAEITGKTFLYLAEGALQDVTRRLLMTWFPERARYEAGEAAPNSEGEKPEGPANSVPDSDIARSDQGGLTQPTVPGRRLSSGG
jgi:hypothetical protein